MIKKLLPYMSKYKKAAFLAIFFAVCEALFELVIPLIMAQIVDVGVQNLDAAYTIKMGILMICIALISLTCGLQLAKYAAIAGQGLGAELRAAQYRKIQTYSFKNIEKFSTGSLITRLTTDVTSIQNSATIGIKLLVRAPIMLIFACIFAASINLELATIFLVTIPILAVAVGTILMKVKPRFQAMQKCVDKLNTTLQENFIGARVVKAFVRHEKEAEKFKDGNDTLFGAAEKAFGLVVFIMPVMQLVMFGSVIAIYWFGGHMVFDGKLAVGEMTSFSSYSFQILMSLMMLAMVLMMISRSIASLGRIFEVLEEEPDIVDPAAPVTEVANGDIEFRNVCFKYEEESELNNLDKINLKIKSGQTIGIIGGTGSAKTSLVQLIPRLYDANEGEVLVGGVNVKDYHLESLRNSVAMVLQKNTLFSGSIRENLKWGNPNATQEQIEAACEASCANEFIGRLPGEYEMDLGQGGVNVSGGQKQRLCIARALLKKPKVLILDDSTSAVDTATDAKIRAAFARDLKDTTKIIIAQRVISVCEADQIIVMDDGKVVAIGKHDELMETCEIYRDVYTSQQEGAGLGE